MTLPSIQTETMIKFLTGLLNTPSPTGFAHAAIEYVASYLKAFPELKVQKTRKGALLVTIPGMRSDAPRGLTAHVDTLGAMVKVIKSSGRLQLTRIGGFPWNYVEGEGCTVFTADGRTVRGSLLLTKPSVHVYGRQEDNKRSDDDVEVRLDAVTHSADDTASLGIQVGDFVAFDPRVEVTNGFVRSRHLDDKACVATIVAAIQAMHDAGLKPAQITYVLISNYEEVGHGGAAGWPADLTELLTVDMAAVGDGQASDEFHASICVKDGGGPYHHALSQRMRALAEQHDIPYKVDIYTYYASDGEALWHAGADVAVALIGPGVDASHNYERTHTDALVATTNWTLAYLLAE
jgi:putative aminopeptidase FrvX